MVETTLSGHGLLNDVRRARQGGFRTELLFLFAPDPALCVARVGLRVQRGGHAVPAEIVERRFFRGLSLLPSYMDCMDRTTIWDVSTEPRLVADSGGGRLVVIDSRAWRLLLDLS